MQKKTHWWHIVWWATRHTHSCRPVHIHTYK